MSLFSAISEAEGWYVAVIGIGTVFVALIAVWLVTEGYAYLFRRWRSDKNGSSLTSDRVSRPPETRNPSLASSVGQTAASEEASLDSEEATVAVIAAVIKTVQEKRARRPARDERAPGMNPWVLEGRLRAMHNLPR